MASPWPGAIILGCYLYFVFTLGPRLMANRPAFKLDRILQVYNVIQILASTYLVYKALTLAWLDRYSFYCEPVDYSYDPHAIEVINAKKKSAVLKLLIKKKILTIYLLFRLHE